MRQINHGQIPLNEDDSDRQREQDDEVFVDPSHGLSPLTRWNLKFSGDSTSISVNDFIFRVETLKQRQNLSWSHICAHFHLLLSNRADEWYWIFLKRQGPSTSWTDLKSALIQEFRDRDSDFEILRTILDFKQENYSFNEFIFKIMKLNGQMTQPLEDHKLLEIVKGNLNFRLWQLSFSARITTLSELKDFCRNAERQLSTRQTVRRQVHEVEIPNQEGSSALEELNSQPTERKILTCWNCGRKGHSFFDCQDTQRRLFCYKCGQKDVTSPNCGRCNLNSKRVNLEPEQIRRSPIPEM